MPSLPLTQYTLFEAAQFGDEAGAVSEGLYDDDAKVAEIEERRDAEDPDFTSSQETFDGSDVFTSSQSSTSSETFNASGVFNSSQSSTSSEASAQPTDEDEDDDDGSSSDSAWSHPSTPVAAEPAEFSSVTQNDHTDNNTLVASQHSQSDGMGLFLPSNSQETEHPEGLPASQGESIGNGESEGPVQAHEFSSSQSSTTYSDALQCHC